MENASRPPSEVLRPAQALPAVDGAVRGHGHLRGWGHGGAAGDHQPGAQPPRWTGGRAAADLHRPVRHRAGVPGHVRHVGQFRGAAPGGAAAQGTGRQDPGRAHRCAGALPHAPPHARAHAGRGHYQRRGLCAGLQRDRPGHCAGLPGLSGPAVAAAVCHAGGGAGAGRQPAGAGAVTRRGGVLEGARSRGSAAQGLPRHQRRRQGAAHAPRGAGAASSTGRLAPPWMPSAASTAAPSTPMCWPRPSVRRCSFC